VWIGAMERLVNLLTKAVKRTKTQGVQRTTEHEEGFISVYVPSKKNAQKFAYIKKNVYLCGEF